MAVDQAAVRRIAHLARIAVTDAEVPHLQDEINAILAFVEALSAVDVSGEDFGVGEMIRHVVGKRGNASGRPKMGDRAEEVP